MQSQSASRVSSPGSWGNQEVRQLSDDVLRQARDENFPVAMRVLPAKRRRELLAIYGFARLVDDLGDDSDGDRAALLDVAEAELDRVYHGWPIDQHFRALQPVVRAHDIPPAPFRRLIEANRRDQRQARYQTKAELHSYCELSANPVGELVLRVFDAATPARIARSNSICTALQILEHLQDVGEDLRRGRIYLPQEDLDRYGCRESDLAARSTPSHVRRLIEHETAHAVELLDQGRPLLGQLKGFACLAVAGYVAGGYATAAALREADFDVLSRAVRPGKRRTASAFVRMVVQR